MPASTKARILAVSYVLMGISAYVARKPMVYVILGCAAAFLLYLVAFRIPTIQNQDAEEARTDDAE